MVQRLGCSVHVGSLWTRDQTCVSCVGRWILYHWATREALNKYFFNCLCLSRTYMFLVQIFPEKCYKIAPWWQKKREYFYLKINNILYVILLYSTSLPWKNVHFNFLMLLIQNYITWKQWIFSAHLKILVFLNRTSVELYLISSCPSHLVTWNFWECIHHKNFISKSNK